MDCHGPKALAFSKGNGQQVIEDLYLVTFEVQPGRITSGHSESLLTVKIMEADNDVPGVRPSRGFGS